ncbi:MULTISPECIES: hypothetical protein [unclassified Haloferax]|uniref:hypothetical protein n=1 Tax=unclassified Haloferax TaxID=2625095 RepID=UPI0028742CEC|nr:MULTISPECIES: hypothetical protein [unclassified Haloferax]MDS0243941.1 hypothetical protein [Haloferax sp. S2CR25]MDS0447062.1 hypothetical protein [Haloferax sp. S2CR25-2]
MALEDANTIYVPFIGEVEIDSLSTLGFLVVGLIGGSTLWNMTDSIGERGAAWLNSTIGSIIGQNPATGQAEDSGGAFD